MTDLFDRFAAAVAAQVSRAWFFAFCVLLVVLWAPSLPVFGSLDTWQLVINTATTILTFLLVALLQNTQDRAMRAVTHKLDAVCAALAEVLDNTDGLDESGATARQLREMTGVDLEPSD